MANSNGMKFRQWVQEKWYEHLEESRVWNGYEPTATAQEYFNKYKYWLKREYQYRVKDQND